VRKTLLTSVSALVLSSSVVMAADMAVKAPPPPAPAPLASWTGCYVGLNAGYAWGNANPTLVGSLVDFFGLEGAAGTPSLSPNGFIGGGQVGCNWQANQFVFGGELDFSGLDGKDSASVSPFFLGKGANTTTFSSQYDWLFTARLRGGFLVQPNWLLYVTGGLAVTRASDSAVCIAAFRGCTGLPNPNSLTWSDSATLTGGTVGGGVETKFAPHWTARVEYLYAKFGHTTAPLTGTSGVPFTISNPPQFSFSHDLNMVRFAINYEFTP
jgi:outer membrane immunogenic protein